MESHTPAVASTEEPLNKQDENSRPSPGFGKRSYTPGTPRIAPSLEVIRALAVIQDGLRQFVMAGGMLKPPEVNERGILVMAIKLNGHTLAIGPEGNFTVDGISVMETRLE